jgi:hypothetical protein
MDRILTCRMAAEMRLILLLLIVVGVSINSYGKSIRLPVKEYTVLKVSFSAQEMTLCKGKSASLTATITPATDEPCVYFESSNTSVVAIDGAAPNLTITGMGPGIAKVSAFVNGNEAASVTVKVLEVSFKSDKIVLLENTTIPLDVMVNPPELASNITFEAVNNGIVTVSDAGNGSWNVKGNTAGSTMIRWKNSSGICDAIWVEVYKITVDSIIFNYDKNSFTRDAINIRKNKDGPLSRAEYSPYYSPEYKPAAYIRNTTNLKIKVFFSCIPLTMNQAFIKGISDDGEISILNNLIGKNVAFVNGHSGPILFDIDKPIPNRIDSTAEYWKWQCDTIDLKKVIKPDFIRTGPHVTFVLLDVPESPWKLTDADYHVPWYDVLENACGWARNATDATATVTKIALNVYQKFPGEWEFIKRVYDGGPSHTPGNFCRLSMILYNQVGGKVDVDCRDVSAIVQLYSQVLGVKGIQVQRINISRSQDFDCNNNEPPYEPNLCDEFCYKKILAIGNINIDANWKTGCWDFHQVTLYNGKIYDACMMVKDNYGVTRIPIAEDLNITGTYHRDLLESGDWNVRPPFLIQDFE